MASRKATFTERAAEKILEATRFVLNEGPAVSGVDMMTRSGVTFFEGELTAALTVATNSRTGPTTTTAKRWRPVAGSTADPIHLELSDAEYTLVNRSKKLSADAGTHVIWIRIGKEWRVIWVDC